VNFGRIGHWVLGLLLFLGWLPDVAFAGLPPLSPEDQALTSIPEQPGAPAVVLYREETDDDNMHYHAVNTRIKVLTDAGRKYADVELPYNRHGFTISEINGRTIHADGSVVPFQGKPFDKVVLKGRSVRLHVKTFTLPDVQVGSILEFHYSLRYDDNALLSPTWIVQDELFQKKAFFKFIPFRARSNTFVELAHGQISQGIAWTPYVPKQPELKTLPSGVQWVELSIDNVPAFIEEPYMPPANIRKWRVAFYYRAELKEQDYWKTEGKFWNKDVENFLGKKKGVSEALAQTIAAGDTPESKVRKIYAFVAQMQNRSYDPPRGTKEEQALGIKRNEGVEDVLRQRSGDHDDLNRLLVAMVREAGIPAWLIWVPARNTGYFDEHYLSTDQFDAEIAIVQLNGKEVDLDPGSKFCPYGVLNWRFSDSRGIRQSPGKGTEYGQTAALNYTQALTKRVARVKLTDHGTAEGSMAVGFFGLEAMERRREGGHTDAEGQKKLLEDEIKSWLPGGSEVTLTNAPAWDKVEEPLVANFKITTPMVVSAGKRWMIPSHLFQVNEKAEFPSATRVNPIYFDYPVQEFDEVHVGLPPNAEIESLPEASKVKLDYAIYDGSMEKESTGQVVSRRAFAIAGMLFKVEEYKDLKGFYDKVKQSDDQPVILKPTARAAGNGN
jgi:hypothetical protein